MTDRAVSHPLTLLPWYEGDWLGDQQGCRSSTDWQGVTDSRHEGKITYMKTFYRQKSDENDFM